jgi:hypothetical protein
VEIHDGGQVGLGHLFLERIDVSEHSGGLGVGGKSWTELGLDSCQCGRELGSGGRSSLDLGKGFVENFGDVE